MDVRTRVPSVVSVISLFSCCAPAHSLTSWTPARHARRRTIAGFTSVERVALSIMSPLFLVNWHKVHVRFRALMWMVAIVLAVVILLGTSHGSYTPRTTHRTVPTRTSWAGRFVPRSNPPGQRSSRGRSIRYDRAARMIRSLRVAMLAVLIGGICSTAAWAHGGHKVVHYHGLAFRVPAQWPVIDLSAHPSTCVRFNRHAVYLGSPSAEQRCPAHQIGRTDAILVENPVRTARAAGGSALPGADGRRRAHPRARAPVTATWGGSSATVAQALGLRRLRASADRTPALTRSPRRAAASRAHTASVGTGLGFDPCATPSASAMSAWKLLAVSLRRCVPRWREHGLQPAEPDDLLGPQRDRRRLAIHSDVGRSPGAGELVRQLLDDPAGTVDLGRDGGGEGRDRRGAGRRHGSRQPDLLRHGGVYAGVERDDDHAELPRRLDEDAARRGVRLRRLQQRRIRDQRPRRRVRDELHRARRHLGRRLERSAHARATRTFLPPTGPPTSACTSTTAART